MRCVLLVVALTSLAFAPAPWPRPAARVDDLKALQGEWQRVRVTISGSPFDESKAPTTVVFEGNRMRYFVSGKPTNEWVFTLTQKASPKQFDRKGTRGHATGLEYLGVYRAERGTFVLCSCPGKRPGDFGGAGPGVYVETFRRAKK